MEEPVSVGATNQCICSNLFLLYDITLPGFNMLSGLQHLGSLPFISGHSCVSCSMQKVLSADVTVINKSRQM